MGEKGTRGAAWIEDYLYQRHLQKEGWERDPTDHRRVHNPKTGQNAHYDQDKQQWIDSKTGEPVTPSGLEPISSGG